MSHGITVPQGCFQKALRRMQRALVEDAAHEAAGSGCYGGGGGGGGGHSSSYSRYCR